MRISCIHICIALCAQFTFFCFGAEKATPFSEVSARVDREYTSLFDLYKELHTHPELSFQEEKTSGRFAIELRKCGFAVTEKVGKWGVVGVRSNGPGPVVLVRTDLDGLPVKEETALPYASTDTTKDYEGNVVPLMHACGHDVHISCAVGVARTLAALTNFWHGTLVIIGQPAEERLGGARAMLADGLFTRFPRPDFCLALHDSADLPAGTIAARAGYTHANVDSVDIVVKGVGGHGAWPQRTKDPIVLACQIVLGLQTIVSREITPGDPAVVTVGSFHGGTKRNVIPDQVKLELTVRSYSDEVRKHTIEAIRRIARGEALAAGVPEDLMPEVTLSDESAAALYNDPALSERLIQRWRDCFGADKVVEQKPMMGAEDFAEFGRTKEKIPVCMFSVGAVDPKVLKTSRQTGHSLPSLHSSKWAPAVEPTIKTGTKAMCMAVLELLAR